MHFINWPRGIGKQRGNEMTEKFVAVKDGDSGLWGVEDERGAILYEADITTEAQARFMAKYHTDHPDAEFERDVWPAWVEHLAKTDPYESALLFVETAPQDELIGRIIEHRRFGDLIAVMRSALENIAKDYDSKQTWVTVAVERRLIARRALDKVQEMTKEGN